MRIDLTREQCLMALRSAQDSQLAQYSQLADVLERALAAFPDGIANDILVERQRQLAKWGDQRHSFPVWLQILLEELGEACQVDLESPTDSDIRKELVQVAAVVVAWIIDIDRERDTP